MSARVVVTGLGLHGAFGDLAGARAALAEGRSAVVACRPPGAEGFPESAGAPAPPPDLTGWLADRKLRKYMNLASELAVLAGGRALADAGLLGDTARLAETALYAATGLIAFDLSEVTHIVAQSTTEDGALDLPRMGREGLRACHPLMPFKMLLNMPVGLVSIVYGLRGDNAVLYPGATEGGSALDAAVRGLRAERLVRALTGGSAQQLEVMPLATLGRRGWLAATPAAAVPGDPAHAGVAPADMGAFVVLERADVAAARGARVLAELRGCAAVRVATGGRARRDEVRRALVAELCAGAPPATVVVTGAIDTADDRAEEALVAALWPAAPPRLVRPDGALGQGGAAALPCALALACGSLGAGPALALASEPDGGIAAVVVEAPS